MFKPIRLQKKPDALGYYGQQQVVLHEKCVLLIGIPARIGCESSEVTRRVSFEVAQNVKDVCFTIEIAHERVFAYRVNIDIPARKSQPRSGDRL